MSQKNLKIMKIAAHARKRKFRNIPSIANEKQNFVRKTLDDFIKIITLDNPNQKAQAAKNVREAIAKLKQNIVSSDHPAWIKTLDTKLSWYIKNTGNQQDAGLTVIKNIFEIYPDVQNQRWLKESFEESEGIDFSTIYRKYYEESRINELFDELVAQLELIIASGNIDSVKVLEALKGLVATLKSNTRNDLTATQGKWEFAKVFFKHLTIETLESIKGIKQPARALRKTMDELNIEFSNVGKKSEKDFIITVKKELPRIPYKALGLPEPEAKEPAKVINSEEKG